MTNPILTLMPELLIMKELVAERDEKMIKQIETILKAVADDSFERAAKIVDSYNENLDWPDWPQCAADIRKLKT